MTRSLFNYGCIVAGLLLTGSAHAQAPAPAPVAAPVAQPVEAAPIYAPPPTATETLPATPAPTPYGGPPSTPVAPPTGAYPTPGAPPAAAPAGFDMGGQSLTPLPPPPAPLDATRIRPSSWRGRYWLGFRLMVTGPVGGEVPARPNLLTLGGGVDFGVRIGNVIGVGMGLSGHIQNRVIASVDTMTGTERRTLSGRMLYWDALFVRLHAPLKKRFQPFLELGGGLASLNRADDGAKVYGAQARLGLGIEGWVTRSVTLGVNGVYRLTALNDRGANRWLVGHAMHGVVELGFHW
jgi:hypothetical protein